MAVPKTPATRQRRNRAVGISTIAASSATRRELVDLAPAVAFHAMTTWTWDVWWSSPLAAEWVDADVPDLLSLALLVDAFWNAAPVDRAKAHAEVRMAAREFGLTPMSRRNLQWEIRKLEQPGKPQPEVNSPSTARDPRLRALG